MKLRSIAHSPIKLGVTQGFCAELRDALKGHAEFPVGARVEIPNGRRTEVHITMPARGKNKATRHIVQVAIDKPKPFMTPQCLAARVLAQLARNTQRLPSTNPLLSLFGLFKNNSSVSADLGVQPRHSVWIESLWA